MSKTQILIYNLKNANKFLGEFSTASDLQTTGLLFSFFLYTFGLLGIIKNFLVTLMSVELMYLNAWASITSPEIVIVLYWFNRSIDCASCQELNFFVETLVTILSSYELQTYFGLSVYGLLFILTLSSIAACNLVIIELAKNLKCAFLGALRSATQKISYKAAIGLPILLVVALIIGLLTWNSISFCWFDYSETTKLKSISRTLYLSVHGTEASRYSEAFDTEASRYLKAFETDNTVRESKFYSKAAVLTGLTVGGLLIGVGASIYKDSPQRSAPSADASELVTALASHEGGGLRPNQIFSLHAHIKEPHLGRVISNLKRDNIQEEQDSVNRWNGIEIAAPEPLPSYLQSPTYKEENDLRSRIDLMAERVTSVYVDTRFSKRDVKPEDLPPQDLGLCECVEDPFGMIEALQLVADEGFINASRQQVLEQNVATYVMYAAFATAGLAVLGFAPRVYHAIKHSLSAECEEDPIFVHDIYYTKPTVRVFSDGSQADVNHILIAGFKEPLSCVVDPVWKDVRANGGDLRRAINPSSGEYIIFLNADGLSESALEELKKTRVLVSDAEDLEGEIENASISFNLLTERDGIANVSYGLLFILALSSLAVYGLIIVGRENNSKYEVIGAPLPMARMISYEVAISLVILPMVTMSGALNLLKIIFAQIMTLWFFFPPPPFISLIFFISMIAETNRTPFDLPETELVLVMLLSVLLLFCAMFFLAEYSNVTLMSLLTIILFFSGAGKAAQLQPFYHPQGLSVKRLVFCFLFVLIRATFLKYR